MTEWKFTLQNINDVAADFRQRFSRRRVFAFHGRMGAGKTTFIHALCGILKVRNTVTSPTFAIINEYGSDAGTIYHIDLYRLKNEEEAIRAGVEECLYSGNTCLVEWPERAPDLFPADTVHAYIDTVDEQTRHIRIADK